MGHHPHKYCSESAELLPFSSSVTVVASDTSIFGAIHGFYTENSIILSERNQLCFGRFEKGIALPRNRAQPIGVLNRTGEPSQSNGSSTHQILQNPTAPGRNVWGE